MTNKLNQQSQYANIRPFKQYLPKIGHQSYIDPAATIIGDVIIGDHCSIWPGVVIRGDVNSIRIGDQTNIQDNSVLHNTHQGPYSDGSLLLIGNNVTVGHGVILHGCTIKDKVLIGMGSTILDHVVIPANVMIGANSLVPQNKQLESGYLYLGNPAKKMRPLNDKEKTFLQYSAETYSKLKNHYL